MPIVDSHAHLYFEHFDPDRSEVLGRARAAGVVAFVSVGTDPVTTKQCFELAASEPDIFPTAGIHPNDAHLVSEADWTVIESFAGDPRCVAIGETGLDWYRNPDQRVEQESAFRRQIALARQHDLPVVIHCREAFADVFRILRDAGAGLRGVMHCFSGTVREATEALELGLHVSFAGPVTYRKNTALRDAPRCVPRDRILIETDCPFLPPESRRGRRNEPGYLEEVVATLADVIALPREQAATLAARNAIALFRLPVDIAPTAQGPD